QEYIELTRGRLHDMLSGQLARLEQTTGDLPPPPPWAEAQPAAAAPAVPAPEPAPEPAPTPASTDEWPNAMRAAPDPTHGGPEAEAEAPRTELGPEATDDAADEEAPPPPASEDEQDLVLDLDNPAGLDEPPEDDPFLDELRKAASDDEPLGPR